jgi:hypothetical protein
MPLTPPYVDNEPWLCACGERTRLLEIYGAFEIEVHSTANVVWQAQVCLEVLDSGGSHIYPLDGDTCILSGSDAQTLNQMMDLVDLFPLQTRTAFGRRLFDICGTSEDPRDRRRPWGALINGPMHQYKGSPASGSAGSAYLPPQTYGSQSIMWYP